MRRVVIVSLATGLLAGGLVCPPLAQRLRASDQVAQTAAAASFQQPARDTQARVQTGSGVIRGRVTRADDGMPLANATVLLEGRALSASRTVTTDERGAFEFRDLPSGQFQVYAFKPGFLRLYYGQRIAQNQSPAAFTLGDGQRLDSMDIALPRGAVIEGRLLDRYGDPIAGARIESMRSRYVNGERQLVHDEGRSSASTDDLGRFRIYNLDAGAHYLSAAVSDVIETDQRPLVFYPGTFSSAEAQPVVLRTGQEVSGIALQIPPVEP
jgi:hypothetical protein